MKILSVAIPCYNSEAYMRKCIESLLPGGEDIEILIVDDGSKKDNTAAVADSYQEKYPTIVKAIHQENGGHGEAVNTGIANASGVYFKVVDSDDWVDSDVLLKIIGLLKELIAGPDTVDMFISNYIYDKVGQKRKRIMQYRLRHAHRTGIHLGRDGKHASGPLYPHAFRHLPDRPSERVRSETAETHLLCGQHFCVPAPSLREEALLPRCGVLPLLISEERTSPSTRPS